MKFFSAVMNYIPQQRGPAGIRILLLTLALVAGVFVQSAKADAIKTVGNTNADYATLGAAFTAINIGSITGAITLQIISGTSEGASAVLNASGGSASYTSVTIYPTVTSCYITGNLLAPLIDLNGADNVTINGSLNGGNTGTDLFIRNQNTTSSSVEQGSTIRFINDATNNTVKYCNIWGSETNNYLGILLFSTTTGTTGNDGNTIDHNNITCDPTVGYRPYNAIYSSGTSGKANSENTISNNNIYNFIAFGSSYSTGINLASNNTAWTISGNSFYETYTLSPSNYSALYFLMISSGINYTITGNYFGGSAPLCAGTALTKTATQNNPFYAMYLSFETGTASSIQGNTIKNISWSNSGNYGFYGMDILAGSVNIGTVTGNTIGAATGTDSINYSAGATDGNFYGIYNISTGITDCQNNTIGSITTANSAGGATNFYGIYRTVSGGTTTISTNTIGSLSTANSINATSASSAASQTVYGIRCSATGANTISGNTIANLTNATSYNTGSVVTGLYYNVGLTASTVSKNFITSLAATVGSTTANIYGVQIATGYAGATTWSNNIISLGGNTITTIYGIYETGVAGQNNNLYFNTVYINGTPASGALNSYALYSEGINNNTRDFRNNIFDNARSNSGATGKHYAAYFYTNPSGTGLTQNYNDYYAPGTGGVLGYFSGSDITTLALWKTATTQDANSLNTNPSFANAGGTSAANYIPSAALPGTTITGYATDYAGTTRAATPTMGAYEWQDLTKTWTGSTSTDWNTSGNWSPISAPISSANVIIPSAPSNQPIVNEAPGTPAICNNLTINSGAVLTIAPGKALTVSGTLTNSAGNSGIIIQSTVAGTGSLMHNTAGINATIQRYIAGSATLTNNVYHLVSVPLTAAAAPTSNLFAGSYLYYFDETQTNPVDNGWVNMGISTTNSLNVTRGYMVYYPGASQTYNFAGLMNNGSFTATTSFTSGAAASNKGINLVPNPYPSSIDWNAASGWTKIYIYDAVYVWNTANYASYVNGVETLGGSRYIAPGQAFFVYAVVPSPVLTMDNNVRVHNSVSFLKNNETIADLLRIHADAGTYSDEIVVRFADGATTGFDGEWDAYKMIGGEDAPQMSSVTADNINLAINSLPLSAEPVTVPLDFTLNSNSDVTFTASGMASFNPATTIYLEDKTLSKMVNLKAGPVYTFNYQTGSASDRFVLHLNGVTGVKENTAAVSGRAFISNGRIYLDLPSMQGHLASITVYNAIGQVIRSQSQMINGISSIEAPLSTGVYIIHVATASQNFVTKVINK